MTNRSLYSPDHRAMEPIKDQLRQVAGVAPSSEWLNECYAALQNGRSQHLTFEMVLEQILFHDLRDVVRNMDRDENYNDAGQSDLSPYVLQLRKAIDESKKNDGRRQELPASFRLLLQVEEICDVSKNSETRLTNDNSGTAGSCQKFCCVDGHLPPNPLMAIEISPIVKAGGVLLPPGTKVLLTGPMTVRHGLMGWHAGNVIVLGGRVERLVQIQQQELQKRIQSSGHGIDPTIRALIWKQNDEHLRNEEDEDERASSDVVEVPSRNHDSASSAAVRQIQTSSVQNSSIAQLSPRPAPPPLRAVIPSQPAAPLSNVVHNRYATLSSTVSPRSESLPHRASMAIPSVASAVSSLVQNRYAVPSSNALPSSRVTHLTSEELTTDIMVEDSSTADVMTFVQLRSFLSRVLQNETEYRRHSNRSFLVGPIQQVGPKLYFNISKRRKIGNTLLTSNDKQYEYVENAKFGNGSVNDCGLITCRISNAILEPCFTLSATEMKKLTRSDKPKSDILVRDGGKLVNQCLYQSGLYEVTLEQSPEIVFHAADSKLLLDGDTPILCLNKRK